MSYAKTKGTAFESAVVKYLFDCGFTTPRRIALSGASGDRGDLWVGENPVKPDLIIECKNYAKEICYKQIEDFVQEAHIEYKNALQVDNVNNVRALLISKRINLGVADSWLIWKNIYNITLRCRFGDVFNKLNFSSCSNENERLILLDKLLKN